MSAQSETLRQNESEGRHGLGKRLRCRRQRISSRILSSPLDCAQPTFSFITGECFRTSPRSDERGGAASLILIDETCAKHSSALEGLQSFAGAEIGTSQKMHETCNDYQVK